MKNLFLSVVLLLTVSLTFALNGDATVESNNSIKTANADFTIDCDATYAVSLETENVNVDFKLQ